MAEVQSLPSNSNIEQERTSQNSVNTTLEQYRPLYNAVRDGDLESVNKFLYDQPIAKTASIMSNGNKALHMAIMFRHFHIVKRLLELMSEDDVLVTNTNGSTALLHAVPDVKNNEIAKLLIYKNDKLLTIANNNLWIPLTFAMECGNTEMARYLYRITPFHVLKPENGGFGATLLIRCYYFQMFDMALDLLNGCPRLAVTLEVQGGQTFLETVATAPLNFLNESQPPWCKRWIYEWIHVFQEPVSSTNELPVSISKMNTIDNCHMISTNLGIKNTHETKHKHYLETIRVACNAISPANKEDLEIARDSLIIAAQQGNADLIVEAIKAEFSLLWTRDKSTGSSIFHLSIKYRQAEVFNLIHGVIQKERFFSFEDNDGNNMLHLAGMLAPSSYLKKVSGAALQMQRELQWFKEVENIMPPMKRKSLNKYGMTPREVFTRDHNDLVKQGEKWMKGTATSCSLVAALVATITFAAAFTVPGGNDQNNGYPIFLQKTFLDKKLFMIFIISDAMSLFSSSTSLFIFLALLTSRYAEDDFLTSLPTRLIIGLLTVFISLIAMMIAFCAALFLMIQAKTWIIIPAALLACVPLILYIWLQIPLLANMFKSTYMPSIFERNAKSWP